MKQRQGGFLISKIKQIGGRRFDKILQEISMRSTARRAKFCMYSGRAEK